MKKAKICRKGSSCGNSCISETKVCRKGLLSPGVQQFLDRRAAGVREGKETQNREVSEGDVRDIVRNFPGEVYGEEVRELQAKIYEARGFNAKPEIVDSPEDIYNHKGLKEGKDGKALVMLRGMPDQKFHDDLREGSEHFVGKGVYGNGTYVATMDEQKNLVVAEALVRNYGSNIAAMGIKKEAKVWEGTDRDLENLQVELAKKWFPDKPVPPDIGLLMAMEGYDGYKAKGGNPPYYVVLNRGMLVVAKEPVPLTEQADNMRKILGLKGK